jgi:hypothetical protein
MDFGMMILSRDGMAAGRVAASAGDDPRRGDIESQRHL